MFQTNTYDVPFDQGGERFFVRDTFTRHNRKARTPQKQRKSLFSAFFKNKGN